MSIPIASAGVVIAIVVVVVVVLLVAVILVTQLPEIRRYLRIRAM